MNIETLDIITAADYQSFDSLMAEFQRFEEKLKRNSNHTFPEAIIMQRFGSPGPKESWFNVYKWIKYVKETELGARKEFETFPMVAEYLFHLSMGQGWFQFQKKSRTPGGKQIQNRNGSNSLKTKNRSALLVADRPLKDYDDRK